MGEHDDVDNPATRWFGGSCERCGHPRSTHLGMHCRKPNCECWGYADSNDEGNDAA
jgi:hypothetical protein